MKTLEAINKLRGRLTRFFIPSRLKPISSKFGYDRGKPINRYWIERFLKDNKKHIKGNVLEVTDSTYTLMFGENRVTKSDVLDINTKNRKANIHGDLRDLRGKVGDNTYDCIILTHVLGLIDNHDAAISELRRIIKPGGVLLFTGSCFGPILGEEIYWRYTPKSVKYLFDKNYKPSNLIIKSYGNVLAGQAFWLGMSQEDFSKKDLEFDDPRFPCIVCAVAIK